MAPESECCDEELLQGGGEGRSPKTKTGYLGEVWMKEGVVDAKTREKRVPGRDNSRGKSPEARTSLSYLWNISKARSTVSKWGVEQLRSMG